MSRKSIAGSFAFLIGGFACSFLLLSWLEYWQYPMLGPMTQQVLSTSTVYSGVVVGRLFFISLISAIVELFPGIDDNISVPVVAGLLTYFLLGQ
jgi:dolichol kinase